MLSVECFRDWGSESDLVDRASDDLRLTSCSKWMAMRGERSWSFVKRMTGVVDGWGE